MRAILAIIWAVLTALLCWGATYFKAPAIQQDILARSTEMISPLNANAVVSVDGRFVTVRGPEPTQESKDKTLAAADDVWGALGPWDGLWVPVAEKAIKKMDYMAFDKKADGSLVLSGSVPTDEARTAYNAAAKAAFKGPIYDQLTVFDGAATPVLPGIDKALKSLATLHNGSLVATPGRFRLSGTTADKGVADALADLAAKTPKLWQVYVSGPTAAAISAAPTVPVSAAPTVPVSAAPNRLVLTRLPDDSVTASGDVPSEEMRKAILAALAVGNPGASVVDRLTVRTDGVLKGEALDHVLAGAKALGGLDWGMFSLDGFKASLTGTAPADKAASLTTLLGSDVVTSIQPPAVNTDANAVAIAEMQVTKLNVALDAARKQADSCTSQIAILTGNLDAAKKQVAACPKNAEVAPVLHTEILKTCNMAMNGLLNDAAITFDTGSDRITLEGLALIDRLVKGAQPCMGNPDFAVKIGGYADNVGGPQENINLSQARAEAVKTAFTARGIPAEAITATGYGEAMPVADNATEQGRQANRRITIEWLLH